MRSRRDVVILTDADNTLWDTNSLFASAQLALLQGVEDHTDKSCAAGDRLEFVRAYDQALAIRHHLHLQYPARMLVAALVEGLSGVGPEVVASDLVRGRRTSRALDDSAVEALLALYNSKLAETPALLPTVLDGLRSAQTHGLPVYVVTEGSAEKQRRTIVERGLTGLVVGVTQVAKTKEQFSRLLLRYYGKDVVVFGDQPSRDIEPAHAAGCFAVLIPSRFRMEPTHTFECSSADYLATDFRDAVLWAVRRKGAEMPLSAE